VSTIALCLGWSVMIVFESDLRESRPELVALLACSYTLVLRAALVPSTPARTGGLGLVGMTAASAAAAILHRGFETSAFQPLPPWAYSAIWGALGVASTTTISWVIYGLRLQVRKAMQLGQYALEEKIGEGGMGSVYRARHAMLRRPTAVKVLSDATESAIERFEREVQITARLTHPNTIAIYDYGRTPDGAFYYAMEYIEGISLEDLVHTDGPQPAARVVHLLVQACGALEEAHAAGLVHRDIKPANMMLTTRGGVPDVVKVLDFGLVKETVDRSSPSVTNPNAVLGTPHYMAPESVLDPDAIDARTDLYALGATAFFLLTGQHVFDGANLVEVCSKHVHAPPPAPSSRAKGVPEALDAVVLACLAKKPEDRPKDAKALATMLRGAGAGEWTREDAAAWWATRAPKPRETAPVSRSAELGRALTVALDERA
jgi:serine/threonine-protein kinase